MSLEFGSNNPHTERARLLLQLDRYAEAEAEVLRALALEPNHWLLHSWLAVCLLQRGAIPEADDAARAAIGADPQAAFAHYTAARVANRRNQESRSLAAIHEALRLAPTDADYHYFLGAVHFDRGRWQPALQAADAGLKNDPRSVHCANLRAMCLAELGESAEAASTIDRALADDPEFYWSHQNRGRLALSSGDVEKAFVHYREALRLNPASAAARNGLVESLKSRHRTYRVLSGLFGSSKSARLGGRLGAAAVVVGVLSVALGAFEQPKAALFVATVLVAVGYWVAVRLYRLWAEPFFLFLLRFDDLGRRALSTDEVRRANLATLSLATTVGLIAAGVVLRMPLFGVLAVPAIFAPLPLNFILRQPPGVLRLWAAVDYLGLIVKSILLLMIPFVGLIVLGSGVAEFHAAMVRRAEARRLEAGL